jgi:hypothetical protein
VEFDGSGDVELDAEDGVSEIGLSAYKTRYANAIGGKMVPTYMLTATDAQREEYTYKMLHRERHDQLLRGLGLIQ